MSFWKYSKDKAALTRLQDEAYHEAAFKEISAGLRRDGLWAKAIIESGGDEVRAKIAYMRLLVSAIRDDHYLAHRAAEIGTNEPAMAAVAAPDPINSYDQDGRTPLMNAVLAGDLHKVRSLLSQGADIAIKDDTFGTSTASDMASLAFRRAQTDEERAVRQDILNALSVAAGI